MTEESTVQKAQLTRSLIGIVSSNKMDKTIVVLIERKVQHPLYKKYIRKSSKLLAHDAENQCNEGDTVRIKQGAPRSKNKSWELVEVLEKARN